MNITPGMAEIVGIYIGDGHIYREGNKFQIGFTGSPRTDRELFEKLQELIFKEWNKEAKIKFRERALRMVFRSKEISNFLIRELGLPYGEGKCEKVEIPKVILKDWNLARHTIRGIMDTDGTIFVSKKPRVKKYPTMEITTTSPVLAEQLREILLEQGFRVGNIRRFKSKLSKRMSHRVPLYGKENVRKWINKIGFSNKYKRDRAIDYLKN